MSSDNNQQQSGMQVTLPIVHFGEEFSLNVSVLGAVFFATATDEAGNATNEPIVLVYLVGANDPIQLDGRTGELFTEWFNRTSGRAQLVNSIIAPRGKGIMVPR